VTYLQRTVTDIVWSLTAKYAMLIKVHCYYYTSGLGVLDDTATSVENHIYLCLVLFQGLKRLSRSQFHLTERDNKSTLPRNPGIA